MTGHLSKPPPGVQLNHNHPLAQGLVGCWLLNEGSGLRANDLSGNNNTGVLTNFEPFTYGTQGWYANSLGISLLFNGTTNYVDCGILPSLEFTTNNFTVESWIRTSTASLNADTVAKRNSNTGTNKGYQVFVSAPHISAMICDGSASRIRLDGTITVNNNKLHHTVVTFNRQSVMSIFIDGVFDSSTSIIAQPGSISNGLSTRIGREISNTVGFYAGEISLSRIWNRALSSTEVQNLFAQPFSMFAFRRTQF